ncbi:hypothetical protein ACWDYH_39625 [Nocardia goodfellowii]
MAATYLDGLDEHLDTLTMAAVGRTPRVSIVIIPTYGYRSSTLTISFGVESPRAATTCAI